MPNHASPSNEAVEGLREPYEIVFEQAGVGMALCALDGRLERVNRALCELLGYAEHELRGMRYHDVTHPDDLELDAELAGRLVAGELTRYSVEKRYVRRDGAIVHGLLTVALLRDATGAPRQVLAQVQDISERRRAADALRASREALAESDRLRSALVNAIPDFVWLKDREGRYRVVNEAAARALGGTVDTIEGVRATDVVARPLAEHFEAQDAAVMATGEPLVTRETATLADGVERHYETIKVPVRDESGGTVGTVGTSRDVTERWTLEAQLRQAQKMEAVGQLAGGIAHDFNNLLTVISGNLQFAREDLPAELSPEHPVRRDLDEIREATERASEPTASATVLLVEDEAALRAAARRMLERRGERAGVPVVYMTGYADESDASQHPSALGGLDALVEKPFRAEDLLDALADVLRVSELSAPG